jgi:hypothetical protein
LSFSGLCLLKHDTLLYPLCGTYLNWYMTTLFSSPFLSFYISCSHNPPLLLRVSVTYLMLHECPSPSICFVAQKGKTLFTFDFLSPFCHKNVPHRYLSFPPHFTYSKAMFKTSRFGFGKWALYYENLSPLSMLGFNSIFSSWTKRVCAKEWMLISNKLAFSVSLGLTGSRFAVRGWKGKKLTSKDKYKCVRRDPPCENN